MESTRTQINPIIILLGLIVFAFASLGFSPQADAYHNSRNQRGGIDVNFDSLNVTYDRQRVIVDYVISSKDWGQLQRNRISPRLELLLPKFSRSHRVDVHGSQVLNNRRGTIIFHGAEISHRNPHVEIQLLGTRGRTHINRISYDNQCGGSIVMAALPSAPAYRQNRQHRQQPVYTQLTTTTSTTKTTTTNSSNHTTRSPRQSTARTSSQRGLRAAVSVRL